jgi:hypothetical protein
MPMTFWQMIYFAGIVAGVYIFIELIGRITDECKVEYKGIFKAWKLAIQKDLERSKTLWRNRHEKKRSS